MITGKEIATLLVDLEDWAKTHGFVATCDIPHRPALHDSWIVTIRFERDELPPLGVHVEEVIRATDLMG